MVRFRVKPISHTHKVKKGKTTVTVSYFTGKWSVTKTLRIGSVKPPETPDTPTVTISDYTLTAKVDNLDNSTNNATSVYFEIVKQSDKGTKKLGPYKAAVKYRSASYSHKVYAGDKYKVRCFAVHEVKPLKGKSYEIKSGWSDYSAEVSTPPNRPSITTLKTISSTEVSIKWDSINSATSYEIQYTTKEAYFDTNTDAVSSKTIESGTSAIITGLDSGGEYFFRIRAVNDSGKSRWTDTKSVTVGKKPAAPTTWSSTTTAVLGETIYLYWIHNSQDGSKSTKADLELYANGILQTVDQSQLTFSYGDEDEEKTHVYELPTTGHEDGAILQWRIRTAGVTGEFSDWSVQRTIDVYAPPVLEMNLLSNKDDVTSTIETLSSFPMYVIANPGPDSQTPISYHLSIITTDDYETQDNITGENKFVGANTEVYSKYFDINEPLIEAISANNVDLENGQTYVVKCVVSMNSGLTAEASTSFSVDWAEEQYSPFGEIMYNEDTYSCSIRAYCFTTQDEFYQYYEDDDPDPVETPEDSDEDVEEETLVEGITLSVYRRDYNGEFIEVATDIDNTNNTFVTDPHPALDYGRYRVIATSTKTGAVSYVDLPNEPIGETSVILQWDEKWSNLIATDDELEEEQTSPLWTGSRVILPYNIDVSDKNSIDVSLVEYIGRKRPVSYYGTQLGETSSWKVEIPKDDTDTLYALRRLAIWTGDVYVREPSGSGYWASVSVSMSQTHCQVTIPVTLDITRVEGGL